MAEHAFLSASAAHRWLNCTAAPHFEAQISDDDGTSPYAEEGTVAHAICELKVQRDFDGLPKRTYNQLLKRIQADPYYDPEMLETSDEYINCIRELVTSYTTAPYVAAEVRLDLSEWVPGGFGTSDCVIIGDGHLTVVDYKHGKGVPVSAVDNPQESLYALGALRMFDPIYGPITDVTLVICQPRITDEPSRFDIPASDLLAWGEWVKPTAQAAFTGKGAQFCPGPHCRFCKGKAVCLARADANSAWADFKDVPFEGRLTEDERAEIEAQAILDGIKANMMTDDDVGAALTECADLVAWYKDLQDYALKRILEGHTIAGYKLVEGRSNRTISDVDGLLALLETNGYPKAMTTDIKPKTLTELEKLVGKKAFNALAAEFITKPRGNPTLVPESDKRPEYSDIEKDFKE